MAISDTAGFKIMVVIVGALAAFGTTFGYNTVWNVPDVHVSGTPAASSNVWTLPLVIDNQGHQAATNARLTIDVNGTIQSYTYASPENVSLVRASSNELIFKIQRLAPNASANFTIAAAAATPTFHIWVTADQGSAKAVYLGASQVSSTGFLNS